MLIRILRVMIVKRFSWWTFKLNTICCLLMSTTRCLVICISYGTSVLVLATGEPTFETWVRGNNELDWKFGFFASFTYQRNEAQQRPQLEEHRIVIFRFRNVGWKIFHYEMQTGVSKILVQPLFCSEESSRIYRWCGLVNQAIDNQHAASDQAMFYS